MKVSAYFYYWLGNTRYEVRMLENGNFVSKHIAPDGISTYIGYENALATGTHRALMYNHILGGWIGEIHARALTEEIEAMPEGTDKMLAIQAYEAMLSSLETSICKQAFAEDFPF